MIDWHRAHADAQRLLDEYGIDLDSTDAVADLGVGQQQLVEIVKALSKDARILLLDESTAAFTESESELLLGILDRLRRHGVTSVYISHRLEEILAISDRVTILRDGQSIETLDTADTDRDQIIQLMVGRSIDELFPRQALGSARWCYRDYNTVAMPETVLRNVYLRPFEAAIAAGAASVMSGFNDLLQQAASQRE